MKTRKRKLQTVRLARADLGTLYDALAFVALRLAGRPLGHDCFALYRRLKRPRRPHPHALPIAQPKAR